MSRALAARISGVCSSSAAAMFSRARFLVAVSAAAPPPSPSCGVLRSGQGLAVTQEIVSCNRAYWLIVSAGGEVDEVELSVGTKWKVGGRAGDRLEMQSDGNVVLYSGSSPLWASGTNGHPGAYLELRDDGELVVVGHDGKTVLWTNHG